MFDSKQYINEKLNISPVTKERFADLRKKLSIGYAVKKFIKENNLVWNPKTRRYDCDGDLKANAIVFDGRFAIEFGCVNGDLIADTTRTLFCR